MPNEAPKADATSEHALSKKSVHLSSLAHGQLAKSAKKLHVTNAEYANAAIAYFAESGLDPRTTSKYSLVKVAGAVNAEAAETRTQNAKIGNTLVAILRSSERNNLNYLQAQEGSLLVYLERIERNILTYLANIEEQVLATMLEYLYRTQAEGHVTRVMTEVLVLRSDHVACSEQKLVASMAGYDEQIERRVITIAEKVAAAKKITSPTLSVRPPVQEPPKPVPTAKSKAGKTDSSGTTTQPPSGN